MGVETMWVADHIATSIVPHSHDYYQMIYCRGGRGAFTVKGEYYHAEPGIAYLVPPMDEHSIIQIDGLHIVEFKFKTHKLPFDEALKQLPTKFKIDGNDSLGILLSEVLNTDLNRTAVGRDATDFVLLLFLTAICRCYSGVFIEDSDEIGGEDGDERGLGARNTMGDLLRVADYIEKHISEQINLDELAKLVHLDKSYLIVRFKEKWGITPMKYVNWLRIERAKGLLADTDMSITEIATEVGFQSVHYFSRFFKEKENMPPNDYRILRQMPEEKEEPVTVTPSDNGGCIGCGLC